MKNPMNSLQTGNDRAPRLALLIAQEHYLTGSGLAKLNTPVAGALVLADHLEWLGFDVTLVGDEPNRDTPLGISDLLGALETFAEKAEALPDATVIFYFAGHGVAHGDDFFMLSETATIQGFRAGGLDLTRVCRRLGRTDGGFTWILGDSCRDHPFPTESERLRRGLTVAGSEEMLLRRTLQLNRGIIALAAGDGDIVFDNADGIGMSRFTSEFIKALRIPGASASTICLRAREAVSAATHQRQRPAVLPFDGTLDVVLNKAMDVAEPQLPARVASTKPWLDHKGPLVSVVPVGAAADAGRKGRRILLSLARPSDWSLNPMAAIDGEPDRRGDIAQTYAEILLDDAPRHLPITEEREARRMLSVLLRFLSILRLRSLRDITRLDDLWHYLCEVQGKHQIGNVIDDPVMAFAMMADRLVATNATASPEFEALSDFLERERDPDSGRSFAARDRIADAAVAPLRDFQDPRFRAVMSGGNVHLADILSDPQVHIVIEHDPSSTPAIRSVTNLWLAAIRIAADAIEPRPPLMIAVPYLSGISSLAFQRSTADVV